MVGYQPLKITGMQTGLVQSREEFILPTDAYPVLENAYVWRERIKRKNGSLFLGRLRLKIGTTDGAGNDVINLGPIPIPTGISSFTIGTAKFVDWGGASPIFLASNNIGTAQLDRATGILTIAGSNPLTDIYFIPGLPVMGICNKEENSENIEETIFFDQHYAYRYIGDLTTGNFEEFLPGYVWHGTDYQFFWSTNYWVTPATAAPVTNHKLFWVTNFNIDQATRDPIRYTASDPATGWIDFAPRISNGDPTQKLLQCLMMLPFRGRMVAFRTFEGTNLASGTQYFQRIRWAAIGSPISDTSTLFPLVGQTNPQAWYDDIRGQGGFLDIPTSQAIMAVGFVRDNLVIYCERSTWQLRYTGRSIAPFQIERVNAELGTESTFSAIQFDTSLVGIGDKGIVQCDSFKSSTIDVKIPDLVFGFRNEENGNKRIFGIRDFQQRLAYWNYPYAVGDVDAKFPNKRLVYNYENDSWAIFQDSFTALGNFQISTAITWEEATFTWEETDFTWAGKPALFPYIVGGNQQGYVNILDQIVSSEESLFISNIIGNDPNVTQIYCPKHNLETDQVIQLIDITGAFSDLNDQIFGVVVVDADNFTIWEYSAQSGDFSEPNVHAAGTYEAGGQIRVRDGFIIQSKKFNFLDEGQNIQLGYIDILMNTTAAGAITMNVYADYNTDNPVNTPPNNINDTTNQPDTFFNTIIPTTSPVPAVNNNSMSSKTWHRVYCPARAGFITTEFTLSNAQLIGDEQQSNVQIDAQVMWMRKAGKQLPLGV